MYKEIAAHIAAGKTDEAEKMILKEKAAGRADLQLYLLEASVAESRGNINAERDAIAEALKLEYDNYELFYMLGLMYRYTNINQAFLCMEQAGFYCNDEVDKIQIEKAKMELKARQGFSVKNLSILIISYNDSELMQECVDSIRRGVPFGAYEIVVVDNHSDDGVEEWLRDQLDIRLIESGENVGFPIGCNIAFRASDKNNDILLMNNDAILTPNSLFWMRMGLYEDRNVGAVGAVSNKASEQVVDGLPDTLEACMEYGRLHNIPMEHPYEERCRLTGFAVMMKKDCWEHVRMDKDLLDPLFSPGYFEDDDLGVRIALAGYRQLLCHNALIYHKGGSGFASSKDALLTGRDKFIEKWGFDIWAYEGVWRELADMIEESHDRPINVLELYCGMGVNLSYIRHLYPNSHVAGVEPDATVAGIGRFMGKIIPGDIETLVLPFPDHSFDYIFAADAIENAVSGKALVEKLARYCKDDGAVVYSLPKDPAGRSEIAGMFKSLGFERSFLDGDLVKVRK